MDEKFIVDWIVLKVPQSSRVKKMVYLLYAYFIQKQLTLYLILHRYNFG